jgi:1-deoxy-D-xylulose-5-phosphate reductoisomerase
MRACIQYALTYPERSEASVDELDLVKLSKMTFFAPDTDVFPLLDLAKRVWKMGGSYGSALNGANEEAVSAFLKGRIMLPRLFEIVEEATVKTGTADATFEAVLEADTAARSFVRERI